MPRSRVLIRTVLSSREGDISQIYFTQTEVAEAGFGCKCRLIRILTDHSKWNQRQTTGWSGHLLMGEVWFTACGSPKPWPTTICRVCGLARTGPILAMRGFRVFKSFETLLAVSAQRQPFLSG